MTNRTLPRFLLAALLTFGWVGGWQTPVAKATMIPGVKLQGGPAEAFIVFSGYLTCNFIRDPDNSSMFNAAERMFKELEDTGTKIFYFTGCFRSKTESVFIQDSANLKTTKRIEIPQIMEYVDDWLAANPRANLNLIGSSYGGWMVVYILKNIDLISDRNQDRLRVFTLDPISHERCTPKNFLKTMMQPSDSDSPCRTYPKGWDELNLPFDQWINFYQNSMGMLHSSPIGFVDDNVYMNYTTPVLNQWGHAYIQKDKEVWDRIRDEIIASRINDFLDSQNQ